LEGIEGWTALALFLQHPDGSIELFRPLLKYVKAHPTRQKSWQDTAAQAIGLLWDYGIATKAGRPDRSARDLFRDFAFALAKGTVSTDGTDATGLYWPSTSYERCKQLIKSVEKFAGWCDFDAGTTSPISPEFVPLVPQTGEQVAAMIRWSRQREGSMLKHITHAPRETKRSHVDHGREPAGRGPEAVKFFPPEDAVRLVWDGYRIPGTDSEPNIFLRYNVRNMMIALLDGWGGLRRSEGLHLWEQDVRQDPVYLDRALVVLNHPAESKVAFTDPLTRGRSTARLTKRPSVRRSRPVADGGCCRPAGSSDNSWRSTSRASAPSARAGFGGRSAKTFQRCFPPTTCWSRSRTRWRRTSPFWANGWRCSRCPLGDPPAAKPPWSHGSIAWGSRISASSAACIVSLATSRWSASPPTLTSWCRCCRGSVRTQLGSV
jgi:hypothetical protein